jgi:hypothetical protein
MALNEERFWLFLTAPPAAPAISTSALARDTLHLLAKGIPEQYQRVRLGAIVGHTDDRRTGGENTPLALWQARAQLGRLYFEEGREDRAASFHTLLDYGTNHDDPVKQRAGRITLARELGVPVQYLPPEQEDRQGFRRRNTMRLANQKSFVPFAIELDVERGTCSARFARERGQSYEITRLLRLPEALVEPASSNPIQLATDSTNRSKQLQERSQHLFHEAITDFCQRAERPLILIDAVACRGVWPWVAGARIDPENFAIGEHPHVEADWGNVRIVRVRTQNAPKVLFDGYLEGTCSETGETVRYDAPKWADAQLFKPTDTQADVYLSFGGLLHTGRIRGSSC